VLMMRAGMPSMGCGSQSSTSPTLPHATLPRIHFSVALHRTANLQHLRVAGEEDGLRPLRPEAVQRPLRVLSSSAVDEARQARASAAA
jgi:hypothetical protein